MSAENPAEAQQTPQSPEAAMETGINIPMPQQAEGLKTDLLDFSSSQISRLEKIGLGEDNVDGAQFKAEVAKDHLLFIDGMNLAVSADRHAEMQTTLNARKEIGDILGIDFLHTPALGKGQDSLTGLYASAGDVWAGVEKEGFEKSLTAGYTFTGDTLKITTVGSTTELPISKNNLKNYEVALGVELPQGITTKITKSSSEGLTASIGGTWEF